MTTWLYILAAGIVAYLTKLIGYLVPAAWLKNKRMTRIAGTLTIGLLASLTVINTLASGQQLAFDSRIGSLVAALIALLFKAPFLVVVIVGAAAAALLRLAGLP
ncbi:AzlD domain-containing protein [Planctomonas sp. JC2975]|uniref:AzlD domain-containing protein n=1 Tax=Planctomonas sp. JC2975 TaxID=2729626 RepID=UPI00147494ED|nr:AzlD domain-containing protein [Planctomonas sp. JC2975]